MRRLALILASALLVLACGDGGTELALDTDSPGFLAAAADATEETASYNFVTVVDLVFEIDPVVDIDVSDAEFMRGSVDGTTSRMTMDPAAMFGDELPVPDSSMEVVSAGSEAYVRGPIFTTFASIDPAFAAIGTEEWGLIDFNEAGDAELDELLASLGGGAGLESTLDLVRAADGVADAGTDTIRGVDVVGLTAEITLADQMAATGQDQLFEQLGVDPTGGIEELLDVATPITVWIDADGLIRRVDQSMDLSEVMIATTGSDATMRFRFVTDVFDFGDADPIEIPEDATDVTEAFLRVLRQGA